MWKKLFGEIKLNQEFLDKVQHLKEEFKKHGFKYDSNADDFHLEQWEMFWHRDQKHHHHHFEQKNYL